MAVAFIFDKGRGDRTPYLLPIESAVGSDRELQATAHQVTAKDMGLVMLPNVWDMIILSGLLVCKTVKQSSWSQCPFSASAS